ncbi:MAG: ribonuclease Z [Oscillospiraceae bacterium]|jgi:hypothetical protein
MIIIVCVDDKLGMAFNHRRQSMDVLLRKKVLDHCKGHKIWMKPYTAKQFESDGQMQNIMVDEDYLNKAATSDFAFVETDSILPFYERIQGIILFRWNRTYPADTYLKIPGTSSDWEISILDEFEGKSHKKITMEFWRKLG